MLTLVIPSRNNKKYITLAYESIRRYLGTEIEVILLDDASTDGTWEWMSDRARLEPNTKAYQNKGPERVGHTVLYDIGAYMASNEVFGIFHADMVATPNYVKNMMRHIGPKKVISGTRIEPPLHPPGPEKFVFDFGWEPEEFKEKEFLQFVKTQEEVDKEKSTKGIFAPWIMRVSDFKAIGGHDKRVFAPMELEDSDLFNRFLLAGYELIQARDAFVYHMTCRGSRFKDGVKIVQEIPVGEGQVWKRAQDSEEYTQLRQIKFREWWRKWHMDVLHDDNMLPIVNPRYDTGFVIKNCNFKLLYFLEPWCDTIYTDIQESEIEKYIKLEQAISKFDIRRRIKPIDENKVNDILIEFDGNQVEPNHVNIIKQLPRMIQDSGEVGIMEFDIFTLDIRRIMSMEKKLIHADEPWYINQLI
jgi:GT2 family glycosyltransferase